MKFAVFFDKVFSGGLLDGLTVHDEKCTFPTLGLAQAYAQTMEGKSCSGWGSPFTAQNCRVERIA